MTKLNKAFKHMRRLGIVAKQKWQCCQTCGCATIERTEKKEVGFVFYHSQDNDCKLKGHNFYLTFGYFGKGNEQIAKLMAVTAVACLRDAGIECEWNGSTSQRIEIKAASLK